MDNYNNHDLFDYSNVQEIDENKLCGTCLNNQYLIGRLIDKGSFGQVYSVRDIKNSSEPLVIKISNGTSLLHHEIKTMKNITETMEKYSLS